MGFTRESDRRGKEIDKGILKRERIGVMFGDEGAVPDCPVRTECCFLDSVDRTSYVEGPSPDGCPVGSEYVFESRLLRKVVLGQPHSLEFSVQPSVSDRSCGRGTD